MRICLMVEGQEDVTWEEWVALGRACEDAGLEGLFRSDHYLSVQGHPDRGSTDAWTLLAALGAVTERIRLGTLVSPVTFRHPALLAKAVATADHVTGGRVELGIGAGWHDPEHAAYGFPFPPMGERMEMLEEQIELVVRQWTEGRFDFAGEHYRVDGLDALPKPVQDPRPPVIVGGLAGPRSARIAAQWADEYNTVFAGPDEARRRRERVETVWERHGRSPDELRFSLMTGCVVGENGRDLESRSRMVMERSGNDAGSVDEWLDSVRGQWVVGPLDEAEDRLRALEDAGVERVMLQMQAHDDLELVALLGDLARRVA